MAVSKPKAEKNIIVASVPEEPFVPHPNNARSLVGNCSKPALVRHTCCRNRDKWLVKNMEWRKPKNLAVFLVLEGGRAMHVTSNKPKRLTVLCCGTQVKVCGAEYDVVFFMGDPKG